MDKIEFNNQVAKIFGLKEEDIIAVWVAKFQDTGNFDVALRIRKDSPKIKRLSALLKESL